MNKLINEVSTYLLQHKDNPVYWEAWNDESLERSIVEDKPIIISIGYAACHWCHVMEHESFEDQEVAEIMNNHFINKIINYNKTIVYYKLKFYKTKMDG